jgi:hypothetical protein
MTLPKDKSMKRTLPHLVSILAALQLIGCATTDDPTGPPSSESRDSVDDPNTPDNQSSPLAGTTPNPGDVSIAQFVANGSGCPNGAPPPTLAPDLRGLKMNLAQPIAVNSNPTSTFAGCTFLVTLAVPQGWSFSFDEAHASGQASLNSGASAQVSVSYWFTGSSATQTIKTVVTGASPTFNLDGAFPSVAWSSCGSSSFATRVHLALLNSSGTQSQASVSSIGDLRIQWKRCP